MQNTPFAIWIKHLFHIKTGLASPLLQEANQVGANAFLYLYVYLLCTSLLFAILTPWMSKSNLIQLILLTNFIVTILISTLYVKESLFLIGLKKLASLPTLKELFAIMIKQALFFYLMMAFLDLSTQQRSFYHALTNPRLLIGSLIFGIAFTIQPGIEMFKNRRP